MKHYCVDGPLDGQVVESVLPRHVVVSSELDIAGLHASPKFYTRATIPADGETALLFVFEETPSIADRSENECEAIYRAAAMVGCVFERKTLDAPGML